jgi:hypothetical protein
MKRGAEDSPILPKKCQGFFYFYWRCAKRTRPKISK